MKLISLIIVAFLMALANPVLAKSTAMTAKTEFIDVSGVKMAYRSIGEGAPLVLANRLRGTLDTWDPEFIDRLAQTHRVILFDYPGVGYSGGTLPDDMHQVANLVAEFTGELGLQKFDLMGWSWGGAMSQVFIVDHPELVSKAVLIGTSPPGQNPFPMQQAWFERAVKPVNDLADEEVLFFEPSSPASLAAGKASHDRIYARAGVVDKIPSTVEAFQVFFKAVGVYKADKAGVRAKLQASQILMLILCGDNDPSVPAANWYPLIGVIPKAQLIILPQSGHGPQHQYPELSTRYISDFLATSGW